MFNNKILLITGGTGSFGNAVLGKFLDTEIAEIRIFSRDEKKQEDMRLKFHSEKLKFYIGDVRDYYSVRDALKGVDYVFHAAALKQVPSCEFYPMEAVKTNVLGTENVLNASIEERVQKVIVLSTDKAVYPINTMGHTKALLEKLMVAKAKMLDNDNTVLCGTRYGNVMASRGSVIPLFIRQIEEKTPITITDPKMTRFLMSLDDAVSLVLHAFEKGTQGDIFVQKAPASTIGDLAEALKILFNSDNDIKIIGTRHGEKLFETLVTREEMSKAIDQKNYFRIPADVRDLNYNKYFFEGEPDVSVQEDYNSHNTRRLNVDEVVELLMTVEEIKEAVLRNKK